MFTFRYILLSRSASTHDTSVSPNPLASSVLTLHPSTRARLERERQMVPLSKVATCAPQFIGVVNETQYYPRRTRPFYGLTYRPFCLHAHISCKATMSKLRCYGFVTLSLLSVACVSAWTNWQLSPRMPCTSKPKMLQPHISCLQNTRAEPYLNIWKVVMGAFHTAPRKTWCSPLECSMDAHNENTVDASTHEQTELMYDGEEYVLMPIPDRGKVSSHAIHGTLFKECCIERYDVYRRKRRQRDPAEISNDTANGNATHVTNLADVVAIVAVGSDLDGHNNIVHGGIMALLIDDVLGFGYFAVLLQEDELKKDTNNDNNGTTTSALIPDVVAVTANLNINYRAPVPSNSIVVVEATLVPNEESNGTRREKNKFNWNVKVMSLDRSTTYCQATSLYVIPKRQLFSQKKNETKEH